MIKSAAGTGKAVLDTPVGLSCSKGKLLSEKISSIIYVDFFPLCGQEVSSHGNLTVKLVEKGGNPFS